MGFKQQTCYIAVCDDCGEEFAHDYTPHWDTKGEGIDEAVDTGEWWSDGTKLLCVGCKDKPHAFVPGEFNPEDCGRCPHPAEEHEPTNEEAIR